MSDLVERLRKPYDRRGVRRVILEAKAAARIEALEAENARLREALKGIEPHLDVIVCYASDMGEHEPNRLAKAARDALKEPRP